MTHYRWGALLVVALCSSLAWASPPSTTWKDDQFWSWFVAHQAAVATIKRGDEPIADELASRLHNVDRRLTFELSVTQKPHEIIVSADGLIAVFPTVQRLVAAAPTIAGWKVFAFRQRKSLKALTIEVAGKRLGADNVMCEVTDHGDKLDVVLHVSGVSASAVDDKLKLAMYLFLDAIVGEYDVETRLAGIEIVATAPPKTAHALSELPTLIDAKKASRH